jgi:hypothetical protein
MSDDATRDAGEIETLLASRQRISEWLHKLGNAAATVPAGVRDRVRSDYQGRLAKVVEELRGHSSAITKNLESLRDDLRTRDKVRASEEEALAEAKLRYTVGEYADEEWKAHEERSGSKLETVGAEIHQLRSEISRMEEVLVQITGAPKPEPVAEAPAEVQVEVEHEDAMPAESEAEGEVYQLGGETFITLDESPDNPRTQSIFDERADDEVQAVEAEAEEAAPPAAPRFTPRSGAIPPRPRQTAKPVEDEMAFLKSVMTDPASSRSSASEQRNAAATASAVATKTLKCQDCGTLNRPTEWYCERCGAELSAV